MVMDKPVQGMAGQGMAGRGMAVQGLAGQGLAGQGMVGPPFDLFLLTFSSFIFLFWTLKLEKILIKESRTIFRKMNVEMIDTK